MEYFQSFTIPSQILIVLAAFIIGVTKAGLKGIDLLTVTITALVFGSKQSTGFVLPLLIVGDVMAVIYYRRHAQWGLFWKLISWMAAGILIGVYLGNDMPETLFKKIIATIIIINILLMVWIEAKAENFAPKNKIFVPIVGLLAGITSMIGNLAGAFANIYFMAQRISKNDFIGTSAWVFLVINVFKMPLQVFYWKNIGLQIIKLDLILIPVLITGFIFGIKIVAKIKDESFGKVIIALSIIGALSLFFR
jgi:uncharacterized protein